MFGNVTALEGLHVTGQYRDRSMQHTWSRHAAWDPHTRVAWQDYGSQRDGGAAHGTWAHTRLPASPPGHKLSHSLTPSLSHSLTLALSLSRPQIEIWVILKYRAVAGAALFRDDGLPPVFL